MDVSVIIVNFSTYKITVKCINSVKRYTHDISYEIILVDNKSGEPEPEPFEILFSSVKVIRLMENVGYAKGINVGIKAATGAYLLLLNSDTILKENSIKITHEYLLKHPEVGAVSARLVFPEGAAQSVAQRFPSIKYQLIELLKLQSFLPKRIGGKILLGSFFNHQSNAKVDWVWGTYFMFPRKILSQLEGNKLDDSFFMYMEDMQWCMDITRIGYEVHFCAQTEIIHLMGASSGNGDKDRFMEKNYLIFLERNYVPLHKFIIKLLSRLLGRVD